MLTEILIISHILVNDFPIRTEIMRPTHCFEITVFRNTLTNVAITVCITNFISLLQVKEPKNKIKNPLSDYETH